VAKGGNNASTVDERISTPEEAQTDDAEEEEPVNIMIQVAGVLVLWAIFFTFVKSYLMKHKADLNYDKVVNVMNTTKFEYEFNKLNRRFSEYSVSRSTKKCKEIYYSLINVLEVYEKCNFIKNSMKHTPFPMTEMWTNGIVLIVFIAIVYIAFTGTGVKQYWTNKNKLDDLVKEIQTAFANPEDRQLKSNSDVEKAEEEDLKAELQRRNLKAEGDKKTLRKRLIQDNNTAEQLKEKIFATAKRKASADKSKLKTKFNNLLESQEFDLLSKEIRDYIQPLKGFPLQKGIDIKKQLDTIDSSVKLDAEKNNDFLDIINELFDEAPKGAFAAAEGEGQSGGGGGQVGGEELSLAEQREILKQYMDRYQSINAQIIGMERDSTYLNSVVAMCILLFGSYFCVKIYANTTRYENMLTSGGSYSRECL
jgi:hypothetical protein